MTEEGKQLLRSVRGGSAPVAAFVDWLCERAEEEGRYEVHIGPECWRTLEIEAGWYTERSNGMRRGVSKGRFWCRDGRNGKWLSAAELVREIERPVWLDLGDWLFATPQQINKE